MGAFTNSNFGSSGDPTKDMQNYKIELERKLRHLLSNIDVTSIILGLSSSRLVGTSASGKLESVSTLTDWIDGTINQLTVTNNLDGSVTLSLPQSIATSSSPQFAGGKFGDVAGGNYSEFESDGTMKSLGNSTVWRDIDFPIIIRTTGANIPTLSLLQGNLTAPKWLVNDYNVCEGQELVHQWKEGSRVYWHLHMITNGQDTTARYVKWEIEFAWVNVDGALSSNSTQSIEYTIPANTPSKTMKIVSIYDWIPTGGLIGGHIYARLKRIASTGTAPTSDPWCGMLQLHIECDTIGSRTISTK